MSPRGPRKRIARGVYEDRAGIEARVQVRGLKQQARFPKTAKGRQDARAWQDRARAALRRKAKAAPAGPFVEDVRRYLAAVTSMPTFTERQLHLEDWCAAFGARRRDSLSSSEIRAQLETWRTLHDWSASALNHRRTALQHLFTVLDGKSGENPVRDVPRFREPEALPRGLPWPTIRAILRAMPPSADRLRCALMAWTGLPHSTLARVTSADVDCRHRTLARPGRKKGAGTRAQLVPLTRRAVWYFRLMDHAGAWGAFDRWHMRREFRAGCRRVEREAAERGDVLDLSGVRVYDLRHSFGSLVYQQTHDLQATAVLMGHASLTTTRRYTLSAVPAALTAAIAKVEAKTGEKVAPARGTGPSDEHDSKGHLVAFTPVSARSSGG